MSDHLLRSVDRFVDLAGLRRELAPYYSDTGRPSADPELMIRMLIIGYCFGIRSERRLCDEVHLNLAYRWFCRLGLDGRVPDHSAFSKNRHGRFRDSDLLRRLFEAVLARCTTPGSTVNPVMFPPGRAKLETVSHAIGSDSQATIGMSNVACCSAWASGLVVTSIAAGLVATTWRASVV